MSKLIVLASDNHYDYAAMEYIKNTHQNADYYFHCGDSELSDKELEGWYVVSGNNDYFATLPDELVVEVEGLRFLLVHGNRDKVNIDNHKTLIEHAKRCNCQVACFGHTHRVFDMEKDGIRLLNPGSTTFPRDGAIGKYMLLYVDGDEIEVEIKDIPKEIYR